MSIYAYRKCCRIHKLMPFENVGPCGLCGKAPKEESTEEEYLAQPQLAGGPVNPNTLYLIGDSDPELYIPLSILR